MGVQTSTLGKMAAGEAFPHPYTSRYTVHLPLFPLRGSNGCSWLGAVRDYDPEDFHHFKLLFVAISVDFLLYSLQAETPNE